MQFDLELSKSRIQEISNADAVAAFFAELGWDISPRIEQTPGNLGITAESTLKPIKRIELIASQETLLQVYLVELKSVTVAETRALAKAFKNRVGDYLLVLTSDYEKIDFVLVERFVPKADSRAVGSPQVGVRPRVLTVDRRNPSTVQQRVLRRFTYTESDPIYQFEKLRAAYGIAEWSEDFFNNRALFSDYFLKQRLPEWEEWAGDPKPAFHSLAKLYQGAPSRFGGKREEVLRKDLLEPTFEILGFQWKTGKKATSDEKEPDYYLSSTGHGKGSDAACLVYPWDRSLDGKDDQRDQDTPDENPGAVVVSLLENEVAPWALVTNGRIWRLYSQKTHSRATNYYEIDLEEALSQRAESIAESFRYFWLFFRSQAFEPETIEVDGKEQTTCFLDRLLEDSQAYAKELGERLKERIFESIFPHLAEGFVKFIRERDGLHAEITQDDLDEVFQGTLTLLYRLLFLLYAEARDLLPVREKRGYYNASLTRLKEEVAEQAGTISDEVPQKLKRNYRDDDYGLSGRLLELFKVVDRGDASLNVPVYNGGLFLTDPDEEDPTSEARNGRFLNQHRVPDRFLAQAVDRLARDIDLKRQDLVFIDFKSLGVRQLGSIYEGLLEFKLRIAQEKMALVKGKKSERIVPYKEAQKDSKLKILSEGRGQNAKERTLSKGTVYLENDKRERKATGSYYTPDHIVEYNVSNAVGPILQEKFEKMRPKLRNAQKERKAFFDKQKALENSGIKPEPMEKADLIGLELVDELFDIKVLDMAMGSGHFLVETVDFITDKAIDFLNAFPWNPVFAHLERMRQTILREMEEQSITIDPKRLTDVNLLKRHILKRCIYGVDLNPMAVELAKVSLWLDCFTLGAPLSFLDHHLKCGNSLIGVTVEEVRDKVEGKEGEEAQQLLFGSQFAGLMLATHLMRHVGDLSDVTSAQVHQSRDEFRRASDALAPFKRMLDIYTSQWFGNTPYREGRGRAAIEINPAVQFLQSAESEDWIREPTKTGGLSDFGREIAETTLQAAGEKRFFHWELEFPEVFYGPREGTTQAIERKKGSGFDAVVGNPPYDVLSEKELGVDISPELTFFASSPPLSPAILGKKNLAKLFVCKAIDCVRFSGGLSLIVPMTLLGDEQYSGVRRHILEKTQILRIEAFPQKDDARKRVFLKRSKQQPSLLFESRNRKKPS